VKFEEKKMIRVYHRTWTAEDEFTVLVHGAAVLNNPQELVAEVLTDDLEEAYRMTQNIEGSWSKPRLMFDEYDRLSENPDFHPEVWVKAPLHVVDGREYGLRSTMMGDIMEKDGVKYQVDFFGFKQVA
jgi:hypothetical protein